jgi:Protein kinase domain
MTRVGKYEISTKLGEGSMGVIYRAQDTVLEREVALKTLSTTGVNDTELLERFYREARACARLRHPNIVTVYDFGEENKTAFIAMELLEGEDLRTVIAERRPLTLEQKLTLMASVCDGLHHAHSKAIIHRDIKPSNIFLGADGQPRILDFGVARMPSSSLTTSGRVLGTPHYMAPEQLTGKTCDHRSDVFSAAIVTFELIAGTHPFHGSSHGSRMRRIVEGSPESLLAVNPDLPARLELTLARALAKNPEERFPTAAAFAEALREQAATAHEVAIDPWPATATFQQQVHGTETMMAELLDCLQKFDDAADQGDVATARSAFDLMCKVGEGDTRFAIALEQSAKRMAELEAAAPMSTQVTPVPVIEPSAPILETPPAPRTPMESAPGDATFLFDKTPITETKPIEVSPPAPAKVVTMPTPPPASVAAPRRPLLLWAGLGVVIAGTALGGGIALLRTPRVERLPAVATAIVDADTLPLRQRPEAKAQVIATAKRGDRLEILRAPQYREQPWTPVQFVSGKTITPTAYVPTANLTQWKGKNDTVAQQLKQLFEPAPATVAAAEPAAEPATPPAPAPATEVKLIPDAEIQIATNFWRNGEYDKSIWILQRLLKAQPNLPAATQLLAKVQKAKEAEGR